MLHAAERLGMAALVEVHDPADVDEVRALRPSLIGINARDLTTFSTDLAHPLRLRPLIDWPARLVFESGIFFAEQAGPPRAAGFAGVLVGEGVVRRPALAGELVAGFQGVTPPDFWGRLYAGLPLQRFDAEEPVGRPLVKVCGVTCRDDALRAVDAGADLIGFILAESPRRADPEMIAKLGDIGALKVGGTVDDASVAAQLQRDGHLDAVQLHGSEPPERCADLAQPYYKAIRVRGRADLDPIDAYRCPRVLVDAPASGRRVDAELIDAAAERRPLWLAGGLDPDNVRAAVDRHAPELVDVSSGLESSPGRKDPAKLRAFFAAIHAPLGTAA
jgi:indole-3-glycerol phosphate synthase/phosphoribosylanthranilate isomerase